MAKEKDVIKLDGKTYKKSAFVIEEEHPAIGRILIVEGIKFKILDEKYVDSLVIALARQGYAPYIGEDVVCFEVCSDEMVEIKQ